MVGQTWWNQYTPLSISLKREVWSVHLFPMHGLRVTSQVYDADKNEHHITSKYFNGMQIDVSQPGGFRCTGAPQVPCHQQPYSITQGCQGCQITRMSNYCNIHARPLLTHWGWDKIATISQTTLSNAFSWMKMLEFWLKFHWSLFLRVQ